ncbi:unnamed protein product [Closterium sp. Yama58-4]|nr:unnamed protein product [Closterium sp. Yama58-4]
MIGEEPRPSDPTLQEDWDERSSAGYYLMSQSLELNQRHHVMHLLPEVECGPKAWTVLKELHAPTSVVATLMLERELSALRLSEGEPVQPVLDKMRDLYAKLATAGITYPEQTKCLKMLSLLPESWLQFTSGLSLPQNQSLWTLEWVRTKILEEDFRRRQLRGGDDGSSGYGMQGSRRGRGRGFGGAGRGAKKDDDSNDQQGGTGWGRGAKSGRGGKSGAGGKMKGSCWYCEKEGHPWFLCYKKPDGWTPQNRHQDGGARRNQKNGANMVADSSDNNPKGNGGTEKKKERTAGQFFHVGDKGEQGDASAKVGAELHPLDYWVLDTGAAWTMTPRKDLLDEIRAAPINEVCSASGHMLKVAGAGRAAFKGADGKPVVLHDVLFVPDLKANLISLRKLGKAGVNTNTDGARTYKGKLGNRVLWDLHESKDVYRSMWQLPALAWHGGGQAGEGSASQGECNAVGGVGVKVSARSGETDWATAHRRLGHVAMPLLKQLEKDGAVKGLKLNGQPPDDNCEICLLSKFTRFPFHSVAGRSKKPLELVHMDLVGPLPVQGHKGERYFLTIVDDWSRLMWAYPLKQKDHAASTILDECVVVYLDDILIYSKNMKEHVEHLRKVFEFLRKNKFYVKLSKSDVALKNVQLFEHIVSAEGVHVDPRKIEAVKKWKVPENVKELQQFLGFANYYNRFVPQYAKIAAPLTDLLKKDTPFKWDTPHQQAMEQLQTALTTAPVLILPDPDKDYVVEADASDQAVGAVLMQDHGRGLQPIAYLSKKLHGVELYYLIHDKEASAIVAFKTVFSLTTAVSNI